MSVNKTITLSWKGEEYKLLITMRHIDMIEENINLVTMAQRCATGDIRFSHAANLLSILLNVAGADTTQEEVYDAMVCSGDVDPMEVINMITEILDVMFYRTKKKPTPKAKSTKKALKRTRGKKSTS